ncbi:MAG TPA: HEAT repeat domain-containing protein [Candidatus Eremiobacteraeota bacterium]|nr:MAG: putative lyase [bacterium ADurb.Bin363]HPZ06736.1 HEAT repeat domain-containing protein [Candidatus Eremiobacteraeota bacterium]
MSEVRKLLSDLKSQNDNIRLNAVRALVKYGESEIVDHVVLLLSDYNPDIRTEAALTLSKIGNERALQPLIKLLSDPNKDARCAAARALGKIGDYRAISHLRTLIRLDHIDEVKKVAVNALSDIDKAIEPMLDKIGQELGSPHIEDRQRAVKFLTIIGTKDAAALLLKALANKDNQIQEALLEALDKLKFLGPEIFIKGLTDENVQVRIACVEFLGQIKSQESIEHLIDLLDVETRMDVKKSIATAFGTMGAEDALYNLRNMLDKSQPDLNNTVINSINQIGGNQAIEFLIRIFLEEEGNSVELAEKSLLTQGYKIIPLLIEEFSIQKDKKRNAIKKIIKQVGEEGVDYFLQLLSSDEVQKRKIAVEFLGELESKISIDALTEISENDSDKAVKSAAAKVLSRLRKKFKSSSGPTFLPSESLLHRVSTFFSEQIEKIRVKGPDIGSLFRADKLRCHNCGGIISRKASSAETGSGMQLEVLRFGKCPLCDKIFCKSCCDVVVIRGLTTVKCPNCNVELIEV